MTGRAEERWLGTRFPNRRSDVLCAACGTCGWSKPGEVVKIVPAERRRVAEWTTWAQHCYQCPGDPQIMFLWLSELGEAARSLGKLWLQPHPVDMREEGR